MSRFAVIGCKTCHRLQAVELRFATATCRRCGVKTELAGVKRFWEGDEAFLAADALQSLSMSKT
jgi:hypothetical protein